MPVRFICPACRQLLSVASRKIGCEVHCPKCNAALIVPGKNDDTAAPSNSLERSQLVSVSEDVNLSELMAYDDIPQMVDAPPEIMSVAAPPIAAPPVSAAPLSAPAVIGADYDRRLVTFPRYVLYAQGALIAVVALVAFVLGIVFGRGGAAPPPVVEVTHEPVLVEGNVTYQIRPGQDVADVGAVVVVVPKESFPTSKFSINGLRPQDPLRADGNYDAVRDIESIDGSYQRVPASGRISIFAKPGKYHVLVISRNATRAKNSSPVPDHLAILDEYFQSASELIGNHQYSLASHDLPGDGPLEIGFRQSGR